MNYSIGFFLAFLLAGCATSTPQADAYLLKNHLIPNSYALENIPFIQRSAGFCSPAALTMALQANGQKILVDEIENLFTEVAAGHPVIVFENLALSWLPGWHYAVVFGYDLSDETVLLHSGPEAFKKWDLRKFERSWKLGTYWGLVLILPGSLSATGNEFSHVKAAAALEELDKLIEADLSYRKILQRWPDSLVAGIGLANIAQKKNKPLEALYWLELLSKSHPDTAVVWHNLAFAQSTLHKNKDAKKSALKALEKASPEEKIIYSKNLKAILIP